MVEESAFEIYLQSKMSQMHFSDQAHCPKFRPNPFRRDICQECHEKIQSHESADQKDIAAALEVSVDNVPSLIWTDPTSEQSLYMGGYKAALNQSFLKEKNVKLIVNAAPSLVHVFGPKYGAKRKKILDAMESSGTKEIKLSWSDEPAFDLQREEIDEVTDEMAEAIKSGSVLVHCAQGKSRSAVIVTAFLCRKLSKTIEVGLKIVKTKRTMAEPNWGFVQQLRQMDRVKPFRDEAIS